MYFFSKKSYFSIFFNVNMIVNACAEKLFLKLIYILLIYAVIKNLENK